MPTAIEIAAVSIRNVRPIKAPRAGNAMNKANRLVLSGLTDAGPVKIYEAASPAHADFIFEATCLVCPGVRFPPILAKSDRFIVCRWIDGHTLSRRAVHADGLESLARLQASLHAIDGKKLPSPGFDYWEDLVVPRFMRAADLVGKGARAEGAVETVRASRSSAPLTLNHPDMSLDNVVHTFSGEQVPIDNELLYRGAGAFMDVLNTLHGLPAQHRVPYLNAYRRLTGETPLPDVAVMRAFWLARHAGASFVAGRVDRLRRVFEMAGARQSERDDFISRVLAWQTSATR